jgi:hypothetical protein
LKKNKGKKGAIIFWLTVKSKNAKDSH